MNKIISLRIGSNKYYCKVDVFWMLEHSDESLAVIFGCKYNVERNIIPFLKLISNYKQYIFFPFDLPFLWQGKSINIVNDLYGFKVYLVDPLFDSRLPINIFSAGNEEFFNWLYGESRG